VVVGGKYSVTVYNYLMCIEVLRTEVELLPTYSLEGKKEPLYFGIKDEDKDTTSSF
jgi:hypothetical protein